MFATWRDATTGKQDGVQRRPQFEVNFDSRFSSREAAKNAKNAKEKLVMAFPCLRLMKFL
jgi:hypothetical protein